MTYLNELFSSFKNKYTNGDVTMENNNMEIGANYIEDIDAAYDEAIQEYLERGDINMKEYMVEDFDKEYEEFDYNDFTNEDEYFIQTSEDEARILAERRRRMIMRAALIGFSTAILNQGIGYLNGYLAAKRKYNK